MAKRNRTQTAATDKRRLKQGRGQGVGEAYQPWLRTQDVASQGVVSRKLGYKTGRNHQLFSMHELNYFLLLEWSPIVLDIREQYPLQPKETTLEIANRLGVTHPTDPRSREPVVMTSDFMITVSMNSGRDYVHQVRTVKPAEELLRPRVLEKLEIERIYWEMQGTDWGIVTERDMPQTVLQNIKLLEPYYSLANRSTLGEDEIGAVERLAHSLITRESLPLRDVAAMCDETLDCEQGTTLVVIYHLLATKHWQIDMDIPIRPRQPLALLN